MASTGITAYVIRKYSTVIMPISIKTFAAKGIRCLLSSLYSSWFGLNGFLTVNSLPSGGYIILSGPSVYHPCSL